jgi:REP element-mobilizing transposase RayT
MRFWLLTNTTYGTWLPGDRRGSVTSVRDFRSDDAPSSVRFEHDRPGEAWEQSLPGLYRSAREAMKGRPIYLDLAQAGIVLAQFQETAGYRKWTLHAVAIMANHFHVVIEVPGDPDPRKVLADLKAYGTRVLNRKFGRPASGTWWTSRGSKRKLPDARAVASAIEYVLYKQQRALVVWSLELGRLV